MKGYIDDNLTPQIENIYIVGKEKVIQLKCVLDTAFNGEFCLPKKYFEECKLQYIGNEDFILADGSIVLEKIYLGQIIIDNKPEIVTLSLTEDNEALLGTQLLDNKIVTLNFKNKTFIVDE